MNLTVAPYGWGTALPIDVQVLLENTASHLNRLMRDPIVDTIVVVAAPCDDFKPRTHNRPSPNDPFFIQLTARATYWARFAYEFAHEFCHVLSDYERLGEGPNNWFQEAICELASVFTLRRMAERWPTCPPYPDRSWAGYAGAIANYAEELMSRKERQLPAGVTLRGWLSPKEEGLRKDPCQREKNAVVAYTLLPVFEGEPAGWNAICRLPASSAMFEDYLHDWYSQVETLDRPFVERIIRLFED